jgi:Asp-tRNA(Asn)/Glu-tRNA(Gln) amidotransferase A subunit family amidase
VSAAPFRWNPDLDPRSLRVGYFKRAFEPDAASEDAGSQQHAHDNAVLDVLRARGFDLLPIDLPQVDTELLAMILLAEAAAAFDAITLKNLDDQLAWQDNEAWPNVFRAARFIPAVEYIQANRLRAQLIRQMAEVMRAVDVFVTPSFGGNVLSITNYTGHPAVVLPNGFTEEGMPTSITFVGGLNQDADTLAVAKAYQDATAWHLRHPPMDFEQGTTV